MIMHESNQRISKEGLKDAGRLLEQRLELVEDLWQTVLRSECPPEQADRLLRLKKLSDPMGLEGADENGSSVAIVLLIREMDLVEAIAAARAFSLYFQLVNILEQRIEEDSYLASIKSSRVNLVEEPFDPFAPPLAS